MKLAITVNAVIRNEESFPTASLASMSSTHFYLGGGDRKGRMNMITINYIKLKEHIIKIVVDT